MTPLKSPRELLQLHQIEEPPIPVESLATSLGASLSYVPFEGDISGMLFRDERGTVIGINSAHHLVRQRFTIAHEIGHLLLHKGNAVIVDRLVRVNMRDERSSTATDRQEIQANQFAAELLMPEHMVRAALSGVSTKSRVDGYLLDELAQAFRVSAQAMEYRLVNLGLRFLS